MSTTTAVPTPSSARTDDLLDDFVLERVDYWARQLARQFHLSDDERDDFRHDMVVELLEAAPRHDPAKATWHTFACRVLDLCSRRIRRDESRRRAREPKCSLEARGQGTASEPHWVVDGHDNIGDLERRLDVDQILASMPPRVREACELLKHLSPPEAARKMGIHRNSIYRLIASARRFFEEAGLDPAGNGAANPARAQM